MNCLFCRIAIKEVGSEIIYEDSNTLGFLDINPISPGHSVVIPKSHAQNIIQLDDSRVPALFLAVKKVTSILNKNLKPSGFTIGINHGEVSGQTIDHIHIHVIPRFAGDGGKSIHSVVTNPPKESIREQADKIRNHHES